MYIVKNALKSISRSMGRNILIGIIVIVIAVSSTISLSIKNAAEISQQESIGQQTVTGNITVDRQKILSSVSVNDRNAMREAMQKYSELSLTDMQKYAKSSFVDKFIYTNSSSVSASGDLKPFDTNDEEDNRGEAQERPAGGQFFKIRKMGEQGDFRITGFSSEDSMTSFLDGSSKITSGSLFNINSANFECIINKELATFNNLKVGDKITLANPNKDTETYTFTIKGIYTNTDASTSEPGMMKFSTDMDSANQIFTSYKALNATIANSTKNATVTTTDGETSTTALREQTSGTYVFKNVNDYNSFKSDVTKMGLSSNYTVTSMDAESYEQSTLPLKNLSNFALILLLIVLGIGGIILIVFNIFNIRERKFEVGVLTAIGMKKKKVALQFIVELFIVTFAAIIIGTAAGAVASVPVANKMLESQITSQQAQTQNQKQNFGIQVGGPGQMQKRFFNSVNYIDNINAATNITVVMQLMGIGILLTLISSMAAVVFVLRYEPLKILSDRS